MYSRGYGMANLEYRVPITPRTPFYIASVSKQFTAASTLLATRQGYFSLDDDIRTYVPEIPDYGPPITVRDLVQHTSGLRDYLSLLDLAGRVGDVYSTDDVLALIGRQQTLNFDPGDEYSYSNSGYVVQSVIVERTTRTSLREFARKNIFEPLEMHDTQYRDNRGQTIPNRATSYVPQEGGGYLIADLPNFEEVGDGGLYTTVQDLFRWDQNFYLQGVGGPGFTSAMLTRGVLNAGDTLEYAFGVQPHQYLGFPVVEHAGGFMGYRAQLLRFPEERLSVICLCNLGSINPSALAYRVAGIYLADRFAEALAPLEGTYYSAELDTAYTMVVEEGQLLIRAGLGREFSLAPDVDADTFRPVAPVAGSFSFAGARLRLDRDPGGAVVGFSLEVGRARHIRFTKR